MKKVKRLDCSVFIKDNSHFHGDIRITGDLVAGDNVTVEGTIDVAGNVYFGNYANVLRVYAGGGENVDVLHDSTNGYVRFGKNSSIGEINAEGDVEIGEGSTAMLIESRYSDIILGDNSKIFMLKDTTGEVFYGKNVKILN